MRPLTLSLRRIALVLAATLPASTACRNGSSSTSAADGTDTVGDDATAGTGNTTATSGGTVDDTGTGGSFDFQPAPGGLRKLLAREYRSTVERLLGPEAAGAAAPPTDVPQEGFDAVGAAILPLDGVVIETYETSARAVAKAAVANRARLTEIAPCVAGSPDAGCYTEVAETLGRMAFRRPLDDEEISRYAAVGEHARDWAEGDFFAGLEFEIAAFLMSPSFLYLVEIGESDPEGGYRKLGANEVATRLSIFLLGRGPDQELLDRAAAGDLDTSEQIRSVAEDLIGSPRARTALAGFFDEYLRVRNLRTTSKNAELFPTYSVDLAEDMRQETLALVNDVIWTRDADYRELFTADYTFVNDRLAQHYKIPSPGSGDVFTKVNWPADQHRAGVLSQAGFLTFQSSSLRNSPTKRGRFVQQSVLCNQIPPPPPEVVPVLPEVPEDATLREVLDMHKDVEGCATCHGSTDPVGFAFEYYDAIGAFRPQENGRDIDASGAISGLGEWNDAVELAALLGVDPRTSMCLINNLIRGQLGHKETPGELDAIIALDAKFGEADFRMQRLLVEFTASPLFNLVDEPK